MPHLEISVFHDTATEYSSFDSVMSKFVKLVLSVPLN